MLIGRQMFCTFNDKYCSFGWYIEMPIDMELSFSLIGHFSPSKQHLMLSHAITSNGASSLIGQLISKFAIKDQISQ